MMSLPASAFMFVGYAFSLLQISASVAPQLQPWLSVRNPSFGLLLALSVINAQICNLQSGGRAAGRKLADPASFIAAFWAERAQGGRQLEADTPAVQVQPLPVVLVLHAQPAT